MVPWVWLMMDEEDALAKKGFEMSRLLVMDHGDAASSLLVERKMLRMRECRMDRTSNEKCLVAVDEVMMSVFVIEGVSVLGVMLPFQQPLNGAEDSACVGRGKPRTYRLSP